MRKSAIFDVNLFSMRKPFVLALIIGLLAFNNIYSQYTESINTYRPGTSQGAFSVGKNVVQAEAGIGISREKHSVFENKTRGFEFQYMFRAGLIKEQLEFSLQGSYLNERVFENVGDSEGPFVSSGFPVNTLGAKYLIYDPYKYNLVNKVNIKSWDANKKFSFKKLIPAVSVYLGANFTSTKSDFAFHNNSDYRASKIQSSISPKLIIAAQNNWTEDLVFVSNIVIDRLTTEFPDLRFILTTTYNFQDKWAILGEYELANSKVYKDNIIRVGGTYLINNDFQLDASVSTNFKDTPSIFGANIGVSYRFDYHKNEDNEIIRTGELKEIEDDIEQMKKDIEDGLLDPSVMKGKYRGVDLETYIDDEEEENTEESDSIASATPKKKRWWQKIGSKRRLRKKAEAEAQEKLNDTSATSVSTTKVLGTGGRMSDFADDEFLQEKRDSIAPKERTPEEQAILDAKMAERDKKKRKKKKFDDGPLIDPLTDEPFSEEELDSMSKREKKKLRKDQAQVKALDDELGSLLTEVETETTARQRKKEAKRKAKLAKKNAKKGIKTKETVDKPIPDDIDAIDKELKKLEADKAKEDKAAEKARIKAEKKAAKEAKKKAKKDAKEELELDIEEPSEE